MTIKIGLRRPAFGQMKHVGLLQVLRGDLIQAAWFASDLINRRRRDACKRCSVQRIDFIGTDQADKAFSCRGVYSGSCHGKTRGTSVCAWGRSAQSDG